MLSELLWRFPTHPNRRCERGLVSVLRVTVTAQAFCVLPSKLINGGKRNTCLTMETGIGRQLGRMTDCHGSLPALKTEAMTHLYVQNIPTDKTGLRKQLVTVQPLNTNREQNTPSMQPMHYFLLISKASGSEV